MACFVKAISKVVVHILNICLCNYKTYVLRIFIHNIKDYMIIRTLNVRLNDNFIAYIQHGYGTWINISPDTFCCFVLLSFGVGPWVFHPHKLISFPPGNKVTTPHGDVIKWEKSRYWPFVRGIHRSPMNYPHKGQWRRALIFPLIYAWINVWANNREAGDYDVTVMSSDFARDK